MVIDQKKRRGKNPVTDLSKGFEEELRRQGAAHPRSLCVFLAPQASAAFRREHLAWMRDKRAVLFDELHSTVVHGSGMYQKCINPSDTSTVRPVCPRPVSLANSQLNGMIWHKTIRAGQLKVLLRIKRLGVRLPPSAPTESGR